MLEINNVTAEIFVTFMLISSITDIKTETLEICQGKETRSQVMKLINTRKAHYADCGR